MALDVTQTTTLAEMIGETYDAAKAALASVARIYSEAEAAAIESAIQTDLDAYEALKDKHLKVSGGRDGVDLDYNRNRQALSRRNRIRLGLSPMSANDLAGDSNAVGVFTVRGGCWM